jgi:4-cresol dehydrogenase (hydroxylating)
MGLASKKLNTNHNLPRKLKLAALDCIRILGLNRVLVTQAQLDPYHANTIGVNRRIPFVVVPNNQKDVVAIVKIANKHRISLYPISTGHNWGYGAANPVKDHCVIVDLSQMNAIREFDPDSGLATVEPGVTQGQITQYLNDHQLPYLAPVHGGGPTCSLVGNALERGYGITPTADHFMAVTALEAVLPDGSIYRSAHEEMGAHDVAKRFKWGIGPYLDGLFGQSNIGIVTQMTIALASRPKHLEAFAFRLKKEEILEEAVRAVRDILNESGMNLSGINLLNIDRMLAMVEPFPENTATKNGVLSEKRKLELSQYHHITPWTGIGAIYGPNRKVIKGIKSQINKRLKPLRARVIFFNTSLINQASKWTCLLPGRFKGELRQFCKMTLETLNIFDGRPSAVALPLSYWISGKQSAPNHPMNPAQDGCGVTWYSPLIPTDPQKVRSFVEMIKKVCKKFEMNPLITLTSVSPHCFDSTIPLLFDRKDPSQVKRAQRCYTALFKEGKKLGFVPYRVGVNHMSLVVNRKKPFWNVVSKIKKAIDPNNIISPGRYGP